MKKISTITLLFFICFSLSAQYKKASFFGKEGRTYGISTQLYAMGDGKGTPVGFAITFGRDRDGKQFFSSWDLQFIPSYKFSFATADINELPLTVSGKSKAHIVYGANYSYHLLKNDDEKRKVKPYISAGFNIVLSGGVKSVDSYTNSYDNKKFLSTENFSAGLRGGLGCLYNFAPKFSLKFDGGYNHQFNVNADDISDNSNTYFMFTSHPYVSLGIRYRMTKD